MATNKELLWILKKKNEIRRSLFPEQLAVIQDQSHLKALWTTRRAGKTYTVLIDFIDDALDHPNAEYAFIAITVKSAKKITWNLLKKIDRQFELGMIFRRAEMSVSLPNGATIQLYGADKPGWANTIYGQDIRKAAIDEAAFYRIDITGLVDDYVEPCTIDQMGQVYLMSIPGHFHFGLFWDITKKFDYKQNYAGVESKSKPGWNVHRWTTHDNPYMKKQFEIAIAKKKANNPDVENDPKFIRNYRGGWSIELGEKVYKFDEKLNLIEVYDKKKGDRYILGIDFGWDDKVAFSLNVWNPDSPHFIKIEGYSESAMMLDTIASYVNMYKESYPKLDIVGDSKHKQIFEEFRRRFDFPVLEAERPNKFDWIATINNDYQNGKIKIVDCEENEAHIEEMAKLVWKIQPNGWKIEQPGLPNDNCDATLMAYRQAYHYRFAEPEKPLEKGSPEYYEKLEEDMWEQQEQQGDEDEYDL